MSFKSGRTALLLISLIPLIGLFAVLARAGTQEPLTRAQTHKANTVKNTGVITGQVLTLDGLPVRRATVSLIGPYDEPKPPHQPGRAPFVTVRANSLGQFRADRLPPGTWVLQCEAEGYFQLHETKTGRGFSVENVEVTAVVGDVRTNGTTGRSAPEPVWLVMRRVSVLRGRILDSEGQPITNQKVFLIEPLDGHWGTSYHFVAVDEKGFFEKEYRLSPNLYRERFPRFPVAERDSEFPVVYDAEKTVLHLGVSIPGRPGYGPLRKFVLQIGKQTYQEFPLVRGASVSGTVYASDGKTPVAGAEVSMADWNTPFENKEPITSQPVVTWERNVKTDAQGHYTKRVDPDVATELSALVFTRDLHLRSTKAHKVRLGDGEHRKGYDFILK